MLTTRELRRVTDESFVGAAGAGQQEIVEKYIRENRHHPGAVNVIVRSIEYTDYSGTIYNGRIHTYGSHITRCTRPLTALLNAIICDQPGIINILLAIPGVDVNAKGYDGVTALLAAVCCGDRNTVAALLARPEIDVNPVNEHGYITRMDNHVCMRMDIDGWDFDAHKGYTALMCAIDRNYPDIAMMLLQVERINVNAVSHRGKTALSMAVEKGYVEIVRTLQARSEIIIVRHAAEQAEERLARQLSRRQQEPNYEEIVNLFALREEKGFSQSREEKIPNRPKQPSFQERLDAIQYDGEIPNECLDIISHGVMNKPIALPRGGQTYDFDSLKGCFEDKAIIRCPLTKKFIRREILQSDANIIIKGGIEKFVKKKENEYANRLNTQSQPMPLDQNDAKPDAEEKVSTLNRKREREARLRLFDPMQNNPPDESGRARKRMRRSS